MKKICPLFILGIIALENSHASAATRDEGLVSSSEAVARTSVFSQKDLLELCVTYDKQPDESPEMRRTRYGNQFACFKTNLKNFDWTKSAQKNFFLSFVGSLGLSINDFSLNAYRAAAGQVSLQRELIRAIYPRAIDPAVVFIQEGFFNPLIRKLKSAQVIPAESKFGVIPCNEGVSLSYMEDMPDSYLLIPLFHSSDHLRRLDVPFGIGNVESQSIFLMQGSRLILDPGFIVDYRRDGSNFVRISQYYGGDPKHPLKCFPKSICADKDTHPVFNILDELLKKEIDERSPDPTIFLSIPQSAQEDTLLDFFLLTQLSQEKDPLLQKANLALLQAYGYFEERVPARAARLSILFEDSPEDTAAAESAEMSIPATSIPHKSYDEIMKDLTEKAKTQLEETVREEIRAEQDAIRQRVITETGTATTALKTSSKSKRMGRGKGAAEAHSRPRAEAAVAAPESDEAIEHRVKALMKTYRLRGLEKFRNLQKVLNLFIKEKASLIAERQRGSHHAISIPEMGSITIAHHGMNDLVPTANILRDLIRTLGSPQ